MPSLPLTAKFTRLYQRCRSFLRRYGYPLQALIRRDFKIRYAPTILGLGWAVIQPLILLLLYTFVFSVILQLKFRPGGSTGDFALYLACGMLPYLGLVEGIQRGSTSLTDNRSMLDKVIFPAEVLPAVGVVSGTVTEIIGLLLLSALLPLFGINVSAWIAFLPLLVLLRTIFALGLAWFVSVLNVFFTDLGQFLGLFLTAWMFLTPIFYPVDMVPDALVWLLDINPLYHLVAAYRAVLLEARSPVPLLPEIVAWTTAAVLFGLWFFRNTVSRAKDFL